MKPFYQGKLDVFCAVYAVANALQKLYAIRVGQAKELFNETLIALPQSPELWFDVVWCKTEYIDLVEWMLSRFGTQQYPLRWERPWEHSLSCPASVVWRELQAWCDSAPGNRTALFRFHRYLPFAGDPIIQHWSVVDHFLGETLFLHDSSKEPNAIYSFGFDDFVTRREDISANQMLLVQPDSVFFLEKAK